MSDNNLKFIESLTVEQFKDRMKVPSIKIKKNPKTGLLFMSYGAAVGAVSNNLDFTDKDVTPIVSFVEGTDKEGKPTKFWMIHNEGEGVATLATF